MAVLNDTSGLSVPLFQVKLKPGTHKLIGCSRRTQGLMVAAGNPLRIAGKDMRYYAKLPPGLAESHVLMIDPMLATGGSAVEAVDLLKEKGARRIQILCIVAAPEGIALVEKHHPDVDIFTPVIDERLNDRKFIVPGLGDFGDRLYGTL